MRNGFKFDGPLTDGVQYLSRQEESEARTAMMQEEEMRSKIADMELKKEDETLIEHIRTSVRSWQSLPKEQQQDFLNIPGEMPGIPSTLNRYQIRLTHQIVRNEYPGLKTTGMGHFVQVTNPTEDQQASAKLIIAQARENDIGKAVGFRWLMEALFGGNITNMPAELFVAGSPGVDMKNQSPKLFLSDLQERLRNKRRGLVGHN